MGGIGIRLGEIRLIGGYQRQVMRIGQIDQLALNRRFIRHPVALQFDIKPIAKQFLQALKPRFGQIALARNQRTINWAFGSAS